MAANMIYNVTGGGTNAGSGSVGGTLTITAPKNVTVTVSKDDKIRTKNSGVTGVVIFRGLVSGIWTITITNGTDTATKTVEIKADYQAEITFFSATINITYPAGLACTATDGVITLTAPDTSGTWVCVVPNKGTWTITAEDWSAEADMTTSGQTETIRLAKWVVKDGTNTVIGLKKQLIAKQPATFTQETGYVHIVAPNASGVLSDVAIDMTGVKTVIADIDVTTYGSNSNGAKIDGNVLVLSTGPSSNFSSALGTIRHYKQSKTKGRQILSIDATNINNVFYVGFAISRTGDFKVYSLRAEV